MTMAVAAGVYEVLCQRAFGRKLLFCMEQAMAEELRALPSELIEALLADYKSL